MDEDCAADVAVVGMACRLPGGIAEPEDYWALLAEGRGTVGPIPADRWGKGFHHPSPEHPGTSYCARGSFLDEVDRFDADFFGISPREAPEIDPQQRVLLETAWAAMEDSGIPRQRWYGSRTGVFMGILAMDYTVLHAKTVGIGGITPYYASGKEFSFGAGRISYTFGLHGPCLMLNTACSSSLMAVHQAVRSLRSGESDAVLAGGVNLMLTPELDVFMSKVWALSPTGTCRPFDAAADGIVRSEGCGVVVLKRYAADAVADGDRIWALVHGSAANHDGRSAGLTVPNAGAQQELLRAALRDARLEPGDLDYVEAHGTGTPLGDPLELSALGEVFGPHRSRRSSALHRLAQGQLRPHGLRRRNQWPHQGGAGGPARGRSAAAEPRAPHAADRLGRLRAGRGHRTGRTPARLGPGAGRGQRVRPVRHQCARRPRCRVRGRRRPERRGRAAFARADPGADRLRAHSGGAAGAGRRAPPSRSAGPTNQSSVTWGTPRTRAAPTTGTVSRSSGGAGPSWPSCSNGTSTARARPRSRPGTPATGPPGRSSTRFPARARSGPAWARTCAASSRYSPRRSTSARSSSPNSPTGLLLDELRRTDGSRLTDTAVAQPGIFAIQLGLSRQFSSWGLEPDAVVGHGMGEAAAAVVAGARWPCPTPPS